MRRFYSGGDACLVFLEPVLVESCGVHLVHLVHLALYTQYAEQELRFPLEVDESRSSNSRQLMYGRYLLYCKNSNNFKVPDPALGTGR